MAKRRYVVRLWPLAPFERPVWAVFVRGARKPIIVSTRSCGDAMDALGRKLNVLAKKRRRNADVSLDTRRVLPRGFDH